MNPVTLLFHLKTRGISLWVDDGNLRYKGPKGAITEDLRAQIQSNKSRLLDLLNGASLSGESLPLIPQARPQPVPLSFGQQRLWFLNQWNPGSPLYNIPVVFRLHGHVNLPALQEAFMALIARHEVLRTIFPTINGNPCQQIRNPADVPDFPLSLEKLSDESTEKRESMLHQMIKAEISRPFDLMQGPLLRAKLLQISVTDVVLILTLHHIIADGWSIELAFRELSTFYTAHVTRQPVTLPPLTIQYADFAIWQRQWLQGAVLDRQLAYWRSQLAEAPLYLDIPTDSPRPPKQAFRGDKFSFTLPSSLTQAIKTLSRQEDVTPFMTLLAAFQLLLLRYTDQRDILVGTPIAGRTHRELEGLIGFFVNTIMLRMQVKGQPTFREILKQVRATCLEAYAHQDLPFEKLVEALQPVRDPSRHPLFQVMFQVFTTKTQGLSLADVHTTQESVSLETAKFDLNCTLQETGDFYAGTLEYDTDLFSRHTMQRLAGHYLHYLESLITNPNQRINKLSVLTDAERHQLLIEWNPPPSQEASSKLCLHHLIDAQAALTPDAVAVVHEKGQLTYGALVNRTNQLAHWLRKKGVGPEIRVGICLERELELIISLLAILKAGGVYVPLDPAAPPKRLRMILEDAEVAMVLTSVALRNELEGDLAHSEIGGAQTFPMIIMDVKKPDWAYEDLSSSFSAVHSENLAYMIYTSGSTGQPKGVGIQHRSVVSLVQWARKQFLPEEFAGVLASTSICFDLSVFELFATLGSGGTVFLAENALALSSLSAASQVTLINSVPSALKELLRQQSVPPSVRVVNLAGEPLQTALVQEIYAVPRIEKVYDLYGPTETTTYSTAAVRSRNGPDTIGKPILNEQIYVTDAMQNLMPVGVPGEMLIGGEGLARGYHRQPAMTAEKFIPHPFGSTPGARVYRCGDLARFRPDGTLEFLGRQDHQVKIRGYRIECGEIETILSAHPSVLETLVLCREDIPNEKNLVAYVIPASDSSLEPVTLRAYLKTRLPDYMLPMAFVRLDALPLTPNGKVDRKVLPPPDQTHRARTMTYVPPRTPLEELVADIWRDLLKVDTISVHDNFFELGGHSLLAIKILSQIQRALSTNLPLYTLFEAPTIEQLALHLQDPPMGEHTDPPAQIRSFSRPTTLPLSYTQERFWILDQYLSDREIHAIPRAFRLKGPLNLDAFRKSVAELIHRHEILRMTFPIVNGQPQAVIAPTLPLDLPCISLEDIPQEQLDAEVQERMKKLIQPFDLAQGPLIRIALLKFQAEDHLFLHTMHHIITDAWSIENFHKELTALYQAFSAGQPSPLPPLPLQYTDYAIWQREQVEGPVGRRDLAYWRKQLSAAPQAQSFPTDYQRKTHQTFRGARARRQLSREFTHRLQIFKSQQRASLFMVLLAGLQVLLYRHTGMTDILVGSLIAGRNHGEHERLLGCFLNTLVLRSTMSDDLPVWQFLEQVRQTVFEAIQHQQLPFEKIVEELHPHRDPSHPPFFQILLNMHNFSDYELELTGLTATEQSFPNPSVYFDMTLYFNEYPDRIHLSLSYNADLYTARTVEWLLDQYEVLLQGIVGNPDCPVSTLPLLPSLKKDAGRSSNVLGHLTTSTPAFTSPLSKESLASLFEEQVRRNPTRLAVKSHTHNLSYVELNQHANQVAHALKDLNGSGPGHIGLLCAQNAPVIWGLLGILKAGKTYVPLDPKIPIDRLETILKDSELEGLICDNQNVALAASLYPFPKNVINCESLDSTESFDTLLNSVPPDTLAYLIYTSGSTGSPKGVMQSHRNVLHHIRTYTQRLRIGPTDLLTLFASYAFDAAVMDIFGALLNGAGLVMWDLRTEAKILNVLRQLDTEGITIYHSTPTVFRHLLSDGTGTANLSTIRAVVLGGEEAQQQDVQLFARYIPPSALFINGLGPTESTTALQYVCNHQTLPQGPLVPVGFPVEDTEVFLLNAQGQPSEIYGEIAIQSPYVALGYWNNPELTNTAFHPGRNHPHARLYRTGDMGRVRADGSIEFLGRRDSQVKIRGYRIELGEIDSLLCQNAMVQNAVVLCREDMPNEKQLVAYIIPTTGNTVNPTLLRSYLQTKLPDYMLPTTFVMLDTLPLTPNGKVDRKALPLPEATHRSSGIAVVAPRTQVEGLLVEIWQDLLKVQDIGVHHNFFELGGHSLLATRLLARLRAVCQNDFPLRLLFDHPILEDQALAIEEHLLQEIEELSEEALPNILEG